jgi:MoxR-like ATPase
MTNWYIFRADHNPHEGIDALPPPPAWRRYARTVAQLHPATPLAVDQFGEELRGSIYLAGQKEIDLVNTALYLRRPLLITGGPGTGKTSLAYAVAYQLRLGPVLHWPITTRTTLQDGLYSYDAIGRLQALELQESATDIGRYLRLGSLGTALLPTRRPRVLLIDEFDKSDIDLPNDLLNVLEEGRFIIPELARLPDDVQYDQIEVGTADNAQATIRRGMVQCYEFPLVVLTSNGERDFPPAFYRRCVRLDIEPPSAEKLVAIVTGQLQPGAELIPLIQQLVTLFVNRREQGQTLATDQLLNAVYLVIHNRDLRDAGLTQLHDVLFRALR